MNWCNFCRTMHPGGDRKPGCPNPDNPSGRLDTMPFPVGAESRERKMSDIKEIRPGATDEEPFATEIDLGIDQLASFDSQGAPGPGVTFEIALDEVRRLTLKLIAVTHERTRLEELLYKWMRRAEQERSRLGAVIAKLDEWDAQIGNSGASDPMRDVVATLRKLIAVERQEPNDV